MTNDLSPAPPSPRPGRLVRFMRRFLFLFICLLTIIGVFYTVENWRGKRVWTDYKKELEAKGESLDFDAFVPASVPDDENMIATPLISRWVYKVNGTNAPAIRIPESGSLYGDWSNAKPTELLEWMEYFYGTNADQPLVIATGSPWKEPASSPTNSPPAEVMPLVVLDHVPLRDAIRTLARQADIKILFGPYVEESGILTNPASLVTLRFEKVTSRQALDAVVDNYGLRIKPVKDDTGNQRYLIEKPSGRIIVKNDKASPDVGTNALLSEINLDFAPFTEAIEDLAKRIGIHFEFDDKALRLFHEKVRTFGIYDETISAHWTNLTALETFQKVLVERHLAITTNQSGNYQLSFRAESATEILQKFEKFEGDFQELYAACAKPKASFKFDHKNLTNREYLNFIGFRSVAQSLALRANAELALHKSEAGLRDIETCVRFADCLTNEPTLVAGMIRVAIHGLIMGPVWEGLASKQWNEKQLTELQERLSQINLITSAGWSLRADRAHQNLLFTDLPQRELSKSLDRTGWGEKEDFSHRLQRLAIAYAPQGWVYQNLTLMNRLRQEINLDAVDFSQGIVNPQKITAAYEKTAHELDTVRPGNFIAIIAHPNFARAFQVIAQNQTGINEAVIACALERYRLAHGNFPDKLESLTPEFLAKVPRDVVNGSPLHYRLTDDHQYILYSVGWDQKDDNGKPTPVAWDKERVGDWVWRFPSRAAASN